jgi:hypothetical protein
VRNVLQLDDGAEVSRIAEQFPDPAIVEFEEFLEGQAGENLRLGKLLRAEAVRIGRQGPLPTIVGDLQHLPRRFGGLHHLLSAQVGADQKRVFYGAVMTPFFYPGTDIS